MKLTSPAEINKYVTKLLVRIESQYEPEQVPVIVERYSSIRNCYINVAKKVELDGGRIHYGWGIYQSEILCEAERHAVWESPEEDLIDITPRETEFKQIMFVSDNDFVYSGQLVDNIRINITGNPLVDDFISLCEDLERIYSYGKRVDDDQMKIANSAMELIEHYEKLKIIYLNYIYSGGRPDKVCFCGGPKNYKNCHGKTFKKEVNENMEAVLKILNK